MSWVYLALLFVFSKEALANLLLSHSRHPILEEECGWWGPYSEKALGPVKDCGEYEKTSLDDAKMKCCECGNCFGISEEDGLYVLRALPVDEMEFGEGLQILTDDEEKTISDTAMWFKEDPHICPPFHDPEHGKLTLYSPFTFHSQSRPFASWLAKYECDRGLVTSDSSGGLVECMHGIWREATRDVLGDNIVIGPPASLSCVRPEYSLFLIEKLMNWEEANAECQYHGGELASFHSDMEHVHTAQLLNGKTAWIGGKLKGNCINGTTSTKPECWEWSDGTAFEYEHWGAFNESQQTDQDCMVYNWFSENSWHILHCDYLLQAVCRIPSDTPEIERKRARVIPTRVEVLKTPPTAFSTIPSVPKTKPPPELGYQYDVGMEPEEVDKLDEPSEQDNRRIPVAVPYDDGKQTAMPGVSAAGDDSVEETRVIKTLELTPLPTMPPVPGVAANTTPPGAPCIDVGDYSICHSHWCKNTGILDDFEEMTPSECKRKCDQNVDCTSFNHFVDHPDHGENYCQIAAACMVENLETYDSSNGMMMLMIKHQKSTPWYSHPFVITFVGLMGLLVAFIVHRIYQKRRDSLVTVPEGTSSSVATETHSNEVTPQSQPEHTILINSETQSPTKKEKILPVVVLGSQPSQRETQDGKATENEQSKLAAPPPDFTKPNALRSVQKRRKKSTKRKRNPKIVGKIHLLPSKPKKAFQCTHCPNSYDQKGNLNVHMKVHLGQRDFDCKQCGKTFARKQILINHIRIHTGETPFKCGTCNKGFKQKNQLTRHVQTHTGAKPFQCDQPNCSKKFADNRALLEHKDKMHGIPMPSLAAVRRTLKKRTINKLNKTKTPNDKPHKPKTKNKRSVKPKAKKSRKGKAKKIGAMKQMKPVSPAPSQGSTKAQNPTQEQTSITKTPQTQLSIQLTPMATCQPPTKQVAKTPTRPPSIQIPTIIQPPKSLHLSSPPLTSLPLTSPSLPLASHSLPLTSPSLPSPPPSSPLLATPPFTISPLSTPPSKSENATLNLLSQSIPTGSPASLTQAPNPLPSPLPNSISLPTHDVSPPNSQKVSTSNFLASPGSTPTPMFLHSSLPTSSSSSSSISTPYSSISTPSTSTSSTSTPSTSNSLTFCMSTEEKSFHLFPTIRASNATLDTELGPLRDPASSDIIYELLDPLKPEKRENEPMLDAICKSKRMNVCVSSGNSIQVAIHDYFSSEDSSEDSCDSFIDGSYEPSWSGLGFDLDTNCFSNVDHKTGTEFTSDNLKDERLWEKGPFCEDTEQFAKFQYGENSPTSSFSVQPSNYPHAESHQKDFPMYSDSLELASSDFGVPMEIKTETSFLTSDSMALDWSEHTDPNLMFCESLLV